MPRMASEHAEPDPEWLDIGRGQDNSDRVSAAVVGDNPGIGSTKNSGSVHADRQATYRAKSGGNKIEGAATGSYSSSLQR